jgi:hypothetical protein
MTITVADYPSLCKVLCDTSEDDVVRHEVASLLQRAKYSGLADVLCQVLDNPKEDARFRSFAAQHLESWLFPIKRVSLNTILNTT